MKKVVIASGNKGKLREIGRILSDLDFEIIPQSKLGIVSVAETGSTFADNALIKARHAAAESGLPAIADDSGLVVDALDGSPGINSARYAGAGASDDIVPRSGSVRTTQ
jgi:XTP/dITP diphosphohydrolase